MRARWGPPAKQAALQVQSHNLSLHLLPKNSAEEWVNQKTITHQVQCVVKFGPYRKCLPRANKPRHFLGLVDKLQVLCATEAHSHKNNDVC